MDDNDRTLCTFLFLFLFRGTDICHFHMGKMRIIQEMKEHETKVD